MNHQSSKADKTRNLIGFLCWRRYSIR